MLKATPDGKYVITCGMDSTIFMFRVIENFREINLERF